MINLIMKNFMSVAVKFESIARNKIKASTKDFIIQKESPSLIHYAAKFNNVSLLKECIAKGQSASLQNPWKETALQKALESHAGDVVRYLVSEYNYDLKSMTDQYGQPIWWAAFDKKGMHLESDKDFQVFNELNYLSTISLLKSLNIDFNQKSEKFYQETLANRLLQNYSHKALYYLLRDDLINVNEMTRMDYENTLAHSGAYMEDSRFIAMKQNSDFVEDCYKMIYQKCNPSLKNKSGLTPLESLCKSGRKMQVELFLSAQPKVKLSISNRLWLKAANKDLHISDVTQVPSDCQEEVNKLVHFEVTSIDGLLYRSEKVLITGLNDQEIKNKTTISLQEVSSMRKIVLPNGTELLKRV